MRQDTGQLVHVILGDFAISTQPGDILTTVLGSCISVCLSDSGLGIGGMNHFLLPHGSGPSCESIRYGAYAMELLINELLKKGAQKERLSAKVFGGAKMIGTARDIGAENAQFARKFLSDEGISISGISVGGQSARRVRFFPVTGRAQQLMVEDTAPEIPVTLPAVTQPSNDVTLF